MNLNIEGIIEGAQRVGQKVSSELPTHTGLAGAVDEVTKAAREAKRVAHQSRKFFSLSRLPAAFLGLALLGFLIWAYMNFFMVATLTLAIPRQDYRDENLKYFRKARISSLRVETSAEAIERVSTGKADLALIQAGIKVPDSLTVLQTPLLEHVVWMTRSEKSDVKSVSVVMTNAQGEGSHSVAIDFFRKWLPDRNIEFRHEWNSVIASPEDPNQNAQVARDIDAVFVVVNVADPRNLETIKEFQRAGFELQSPYIGAHTNQLKYTDEFLMPSGFISQIPPIPSRELLTYTIPNVLIARRGISDSTLANLSKVFETNARKLKANEYSFDVKDASEVFQGMDAFLGILINIILGFVALLGLEMWVYRKRFHELNSLVSLLSMLQSNKDILGETDPERRSENLQYLSIVSDLLSMISAINGFYTQENSALLFNNQTEVIHQRCDNLKLNIQLKILHAGIRLEPRKPQTDSLNPTSSNTKLPSSQAESPPMPAPSL